MFRQYVMPEPLLSADAVVSVQTIKNHRFMGTTLCLKNLFGLLPQQPLPCQAILPSPDSHVLYAADPGLILQPALNILDGMICQANAEWGGDAIGNTIVAGDHVIATDVVGTHLMGHQAEKDWPNQPYVRDRNPSDGSRSRL